MRVSDAIYMNSGFTFCTENNYDYAGGLQYYGTYQQLPSSRYLHVHRIPTSPAVRWKNFLIVKSTRNVIGVDYTTRRYFVIDILTDCASYGDVLANSGVQEKIVVYTTIANNTGGTTGSGSAGVTRVRIFGERVNNS
jgi:hypothetical protein